MQDTWYTVENVSELDSPALLLYHKRVQQNIDRMIHMAGNADRLLVHVKTNKMPGVVKMLLASGISRFKCATLAEAAMVARAGGRYLILAHQLVGPKINSLVQLRRQFPDVFMASLVDCREQADRHQKIFASTGLIADVFLDINNGMDRSGHPLDDQLLPLYSYLQQQPGLRCHGLHIYDGHWRDTDFNTRKEKIDQDFRGIEELLAAIQMEGLPRPMVVAGGTPSFTTHLLRKDTYCSPGTCVLWDWGYGEKLSEQTFDFAALVLSRVISKPAPGIISIDLGHKAIAAENSIDKRVRFLNLENYQLLSQSEEHGVLQVTDWDKWQVGDVLYGVPYHICPTVNLYDRAYVVREGKAMESWEVLGSSRKISN